MKTMINAMASRWRNRATQQENLVRAAWPRVSNSLFICGTLNLSHLMRIGYRLLPIDPPLHFIRLDHRWHFPTIHHS